MKKNRFLYFFLIFLTSPYIGFAVYQENCNITTCDDNYENYIYLSNFQNSQIVYVCTGAYAYAYHSRSDCPGLRNCKGEIKYIYENVAVNSLRRIPCCRCWSNAAGRCKDDNPYGISPGSGGDNSEAYAFLGLAIVASSAFILSNDLYVYPTISFYDPTKNNYNFGGQSTNGVGIGLIFGMRKTFKHSALEYGASYLKSNMTFNYINGYTNSYATDRWGGHFNYVHQVFYNKTPNRLKIYFGPSINYVYNFGYGGIIGTEMKLFNRLSFDVRYELTTQTNQFQAGLIFTYQKRYFWQKR